MTLQTIQIIGTDSADMVTKFNTFLTNADDMFIFTDFSIRTQFNVKRREPEYIATVTIHSLTLCAKSMDL